MQVSLTSTGRGSKVTVVVQISVTTAGCSSEVGDVQVTFATAGHSSEVRDVQVTFAAAGHSSEVRDVQVTFAAASRSSEVGVTMQIIVAPASRVSKVTARRQCCQLSPGGASVQGDARRARAGSHAGGE